MKPAKILAPLTGGTRDATVLASAFAAAKLFNAHVVALFVRPDPAEAMPFFGEGVSGAVAQEIIDAAKEAADSAATTAKASLAAAASVADASLTDVPVRRDAPTASWREVQGNFADQVVQASLLSDLVVFGPLSERDKPGLTEAFEAALLETGRPVLLTAHAPSKNLARNIAIGWNGSAPSAHAVTEALSYLKNAESIEILTVGKHPGSEPAGLVEYLGLHGLTASQRVIDGAGRATGEALLAAAAGSGASMLVLGGYGHTRMRELFAGGVTRHVVSHAEIPLFLVH